MIRFCTLLLPTYLLFSCDVATIKTVELPAAPERLVVIGLATNLGLGVFVSKSAPVVAPKADATFLDVTVSLQRGGTKVTDLRKGSQLYLSDSTWAYNQEYVLNVRHPILGEASARLDPLPEKITIQEAIVRVGYHDSEADVSFTFQDKPGEDYYAYQVVPLVDGKPFPSQSIFQIQPGNVLNDLSFENQKKLITTRLFRNVQLTNGSTLTASQFCIYLYHLSKSSYSYYRSLREYDSYHDDTFAGPLLVDNNIMNGYGFLGSSYIDSITVSLE